MAGGSGKPTQVTNTDPWKGQQPYLTKGFQGAEQGVLNQPGVVPFSPETQYGLYGTANRALQGSPLLGQGQNMISSTLAGDYMSGGPGMDAFANAAWSAVRPNVDSVFAGGGRYGSTAHGEALGRGFGNAMGPYFDSERSRQMQSAFGAPGMAEADYMDFNKLLGVGAAREGQAQQYQDEAYNRLARYMGLVSGNYGGTTTQTGGQKGSPLLGGIGGAATGAYVGDALGYPGWGAVAGGLLGALGS